VAADVGHAALDRGARACPVGARVVLDPAVALGASPPKRQTMSKNFSAPMSDPKPDSVTT
jgi:hypothetical protein